MPSIDFTEEERSALAQFLRETIAADRFPLSPRRAGGLAGELIRAALPRLT